METNLKKAKIFARLFLAIMLVIVGAVSKSRASLDKKLEIEYLKPIELNINSGGINRLNFGDERIKKIVGDVSQYRAVLSDNGSDLFLTSKLAPSGVIDLTLMTARSRAIDLRLHVRDKADGAIISLELNEQNDFEQDERLEIAKMIEAMKSNTWGKYFVEDRTRVIKLPNKPGKVLNEYVSYRYGDLMGAGFYEKRKRGSKLGREDIKGLFKDVLAMSIDDSGNELRVFVVFKACEEMDV